MMPVGLVTVDPARKAFAAGANAIVDRAVLKRILYLLCCFFQMCEFVEKLMCVCDDVFPQMKFMRAHKYCAVQCLVHV